MFGATLAGEGSLKNMTNEEEYRRESFNFQKFLYESIEDPIKKASQILAANGLK